MKELNAVLNAFRKLPTKKSVMNKAIRETANPLLRKMRQRTPKKSGALRKSIGLAKYRNVNEGVVSYAGIRTKKKVNVRRGRYSSWRVFYGRILEGGTNQRIAKKGRVRGKDFGSLSPMGIYSSSKDVLSQETLVNEVVKGMSIEASKLINRFTKPRI